MAIPENQLETWSHQGSTTQSAATYATIKGVLGDANSPYYAKSFTTFLQGSYGNDTNVYADSDVDIVICLNDAFQHDLSAISAGEQQAFKLAHSDATYGHRDFKREVQGWLERKYPNDVLPGSKAITIRANGSRREADVLPCLKFRRYQRFNTVSDQEYHEGIYFFPASGGRIENFPKQHSANGTAKHQDTNQWFKPMVRIWKNMRNSMIADGAIPNGLAPSYFIEGMLWNVPSELYGASYKATFMAAYQWLRSADKASLVCANRLHWLLRDGRATSWKPDDQETFMKAVATYWDDW